MEDTEINRDEETRHLAYRLWQEEGQPDGYAVQHWLKAETILLEKDRPRSEPKALKNTKSKKSSGR